MPLPLPALPEGFDLQDLVQTLISPWDDARAALLAAIASATTSIYIADYGLTMPDLVDALIAKAAQGVRVVVVLDHTESTGTAEHPLVLRLVEAATRTPLLSVVIATSPTGHIMHLKTMVIDAWLVVDGSYNFSGKRNEEGAQAEVNDLNIVPSRKRAALFTGRIMALHDWALTHEARYQVIGPEATIGARPPDGGDVAPSPRTTSPTPTPAAEPERTAPDALTNASASPSPAPIPTVVP